MARRGGCRTANRTGAAAVVPPGNPQRIRIPQLTDDAPSRRRTTGYTRRARRPNPILPPARNGGLARDVSPGSCHRAFNVWLYRCWGAGTIMDAMTDFLTGYVVAAGAGLAGDLGLKASRRSTGGALRSEERPVGE